MSETDYATYEELKKLTENLRQQFLESHLRMERELSEKRDEVYALRKQVNRLRVRVDEMAKKVGEFTLLMGVAHHQENKDGE